MGGVGIDLLDVARLERALERRPRLAERLFTDAERSFAAARGQPARHLAVRFCAKEAVAKALGMQAWSWQDVEMPSGGEDARVVLHGDMATRASELGVRVAVSLTHTRTMAGAVAVLR